MKKLRLKRRFYFRPIHFLLLLAVDLCVLAGVLIPQQSALRDANYQLEQKNQELIDAQREYMREMDNLEYMRTTKYKLQQGSIKYGWHFEEDTLIEDSATPTPSPSTTLSPSTPSINP